MSFSVTQDPGPPVIRFGSPTNGQVFEPFTPITIFLGVTFTDDSRLGVDLFANSNRVALLTAAPYQFVVAGFPTGEYDFVATATNNLGNVGTSPIIRIAVAKVILDQPVIDRGAISFSVTGLIPGKSLVIDASSDLRDWLPVFTNVVSEAQIRFSEIMSENRPTRFYRARLQ